MIMFFFLSPSESVKIYACGTWFDLFSCLPGLIIAVSEKILSVGTSPSMIPSTTFNEVTNLFCVFQFKANILLA